MLPETSLLRKLPVAIEATQRLRLEALVFATDVLSLALETLRQLASRHGSSVDDIRDAERLAMFVQAWAIVDQIHVVRQLLVGLSNGSMGPKSTKFCADCEAATLLRNEMDHLHAKVGNLAKRKGMRAPLFGALSYLVVESHQIAERDGKRIVEGATGVTVMAGTVPNGKLLFPISTMPRGVPVSAFKLFAFDREFDLEAAVLSLRDILIPWESAMATEIRSQLDAVAARTGTPVEQLMTPAPFAGMTIAATFAYDVEQPPSDQSD